MGQRERILREFFENPNKEFQIRALSRLTKVPKTTTARLLVQLQKEGIIKHVKAFRANESSSKYRNLKKIMFLQELYDSGLVDELEEMNPRCIFLFGSFAKGEYGKESDIDIFLQTAQKNINLDKYEKKFKHPIHLTFEQDITKLTKELLNNIINGIKLAGHIRT